MPNRILTLRCSEGSLTLKNFLKSFEKNQQTTKEHKIYPAFKKLRTVDKPGLKAIKLFFMLNSTENAIYPAHKC